MAEAQDAIAAAQSLAVAKTQASVALASAIISNSGKNWNLEMAAELIQSAHSCSRIREMADISIGARTRSA